MTSEPYSSAVRQLFAAASHAGAIANAAQSGAEAQGVRIRLSARLSGGRIEELRFLARGCPHTIAAAEYVCETYEGRELADLESFKAAEVMQTLAVPVEKTGRILVIEDAVRSLGRAARDDCTAAKT